ncbi:MULTISPECIES: serine hydrolase [Niastella]|uniref:Serine hydrolase n=1 Tax=Niastella soli TaxID=2821487 RepID=A0ABS3YPT6_9BACT|nr:serine hydrolase [Niastella soli]MBO9199854.1 serine hydrolase [Niastella soli]
MKKYLSFLTGCLFIITNMYAQRTPAFITDSLDIYVERALKEWQIPGIAVCVVKDGKVVVMKGYGVKEMGATDRIDENTLFMIGSNTKAFTATALAMLAVDKKLSLDDAVIKWLPDFKMYDPWVTKEANIRDLLSHRLGFATFQGDFMYWDSDLTPAEVREKFGRVKPLYSYRSRWGYSNAAYLTAGEIIPKVTGKSWAAFLKDSLFIPLGMNNSLTLSKDITTAPNKAMGHTVELGILKKTHYGRLDNLAPATSLSSSIQDMSHWVMAQLNDGKYNGKQVIPTEARIQTWSSNSIISNVSARFNKAHFLTYGLGWFLHDYNSRKIVWHTGGANGFVSSVTLVPEENLGIIVLTNTDANNFYENLRDEIVDAYLDQPYHNYSQEGSTTSINDQKEELLWLKEKRDTIAMKLPTTLPIDSYTGNYKDDVYGKMTITLENGKLTARFEHHQGRYVTLEPLGGNRFLALFSEPMYGMKVWPFTTSKGKVSSVTMSADYVEYTSYEFYKK